MLKILITLIACGLATTGGVLFLLKSFSKKTQSGSSSEVEEQETAIRELDAAIGSAIGYITPMTPLSEAVQREQDIANIRNELATESKKLADLDAQLGKLQKSVEAAEAAHNELKRGKEDAQQLSDEIKGRKEELASEMKRIETDIAQSQVQLTVISGEVSLTKEQKAAFASVQTSLENMAKQLTTLQEIYTVASTRFVNLETQYRELEKEFTKLVEKELSGKFE